MLANKSALVLLYKSAHILSTPTWAYIPNSKYQQYLHIKVQTLFTLTRGHVSNGKHGKYCCKSARIVYPDTGIYAKK